MTLSSDFSQAAINVLVVDDEPNIRKALSACLEADGHQAVSVSNARDAIDAARRQSFDLAFVDLRLGSDAGIDLIPALLADSPWLKIVIITAYASIDTAVESIRRGATDYLPKPFTPGQVGIVTQKVAVLRELEHKVAGLTRALDESGPGADLTSTSPAMQRAIDMARQVAPTEANVMIRGESGTGKGVVAGAMHAWSPRASKPFVVVACPSLSAELLESELFGHVRGAFTSAVRDNPGRIAMCEGGTLFLDEIGELPLKLQPKLLRFVQSREYERVGDHVTRRADVRIISATNADLKAAVVQGRFRQDLFYRLNVIEIEMPPLRDRPDDVVRLAESLLVFFSRRDHRPARGYTPQAIEALRSYNWPGNVRELRNVVERAVILCRGELVGPEHLAVQPTGHGRPVTVGDPVSLEQLEELHIRAVLASAKSAEEAATVLGMDRATLWRRRKKYGL
jgi:two-component system, NtrC family, response regulator AlgB